MPSDDLTFSKELFWQTVIEGIKIKITPSVDKGRILVRILVTCHHLQRTKYDTQRPSLGYNQDNLVSLMFSADQIDRPPLKVWLPEVTELSRIYRRDGLCVSFLGLEMETFVYKRIWTDWLIIVAHSQFIVKQVSPFFLLEIFQSLY